MFWAVCHSSSGAPTVFAASGLHTHVVTGRSQIWVGTDQHVSSGMSLIIRSPNCICILWFTYACGDLLNMFRAVCRSSSGAPTVFAASALHTHVVTTRSQVWVGTPVPTQTWPRAVTTCVCKPEAANTVGAPDDERHTPRNMLSF